MNVINLAAHSEPVPGPDLVREPAAETLNAIARLARRVFGAPVAQVAIVEELHERQFIPGQQGLPEPWASQREVPLTHSLCKHVKWRNAPLVMPDAAAHPLAADSPALREMGIAAYLGAPIHAPGGEAVGAISVTDTAPRDWSLEDIGAIVDLARCVDEAIRLSAETRARAELRARLDAKHAQTNRYSALREAITMAFMAPDLSVSNRFESLLREGCRALDLDSGSIARVSGDDAELLFACHRGVAMPRRQRCALGGSLASLALAGEAQVHFRSTDCSAARGRHALDGRIPASYVGTPLIFDGALFGVLEFSSCLPRVQGWSEEELSMLSMMTMLVCAQLGIYGQIRTVRNSDSALLAYLTEMQAQA